MKKIMPLQTQASRGFSLIELLVTVTIMVLMIGMGMAGFFQFNNRQQLVGAAKELQEYLRTAQTKARVGDRPSGCSRLEKYSVIMAADSPIVHVVTICDGGLTVQDSVHQLNPTVNTTGVINISYLVLHGGAQGAGTITLAHDSGLQYEFEVTQGGEIRTGTFVTP